MGGGGPGHEGSALPLRGPLGHLTGMQLVVVAERVTMFADLSRSA